MGKKILLLIALSIGLYCTTSAQTFRSINNPPNYLWSDPNSWDLGSVPGAGDTVFILNNDTVILSSSTSVDRITVRGSGEFVVNSGQTLTVSEDFRIQAQNQNGNTTHVEVNGTINAGRHLTLSTRRRINYSVVVNGTGSISTTSNFTIIGDTTNSRASIEVDVSVGNNCTFQNRYTDGELAMDLKSTINAANNITLRSRDGADSNNLTLDMRFTGAELIIGNNLNQTDGGGFILNDASTSSSISFATPAKVDIDAQTTYHDLHIRGSGTLGSDIDYNTVLGDIIIDNGAVVNTNRRAWTISNGNLVVNGSITSGSGADSVLFTGTSAQTISGSGSATFERLYINNASGVNNTLNIDVIRYLGILSGTFNTGGAVTLISSSTRTALITEIGNNGSGAAISGNVNCQRTINGAASTGYRQICSPVQQTTLADFQLGTSPTGFYYYGFTNSNQPSSGGYNSCYQYSPDAAQSGGSEDDGWVAATNTSNSVTPHQAWSIYCGGSTGAGANTDYILSTSGTVYSGAVTLNSTNSNVADNSTVIMPWGLIGNPYPCTIDWDLVTKSGVASIAQVFGQDDYNGYRATNFNNNARRFSPFQAFWVETTSASPSITFNENDKITNNIDLRKNIDLDSRLYIDLIDSTNGFKLGACIELNSNAKQTYDPDLDGLIFSNPYPYPNLYFPIDDTLHAQVFSTDKSMAQEIPLEVYSATGKTGRLSLVFAALPKTDACFLLEDKFLGTFTPIAEGDAYSFNSVDAAGANRFVIHYAPGITEWEVSHVSCNGDQDGMIEFKTSEDYYFPTLLNADSMRINTISKHESQVAAGLKAGNYTIQVLGYYGCDNTQQVVTIIEPAKVLSQFSTNHSILNVNENFEVDNKSIGATTYFWNFGDGSSSSDFEPQHQYRTSGTYTLSLTAMNEECKNDSKIFLQVAPDPVSTNSNQTSKDFKILSNDGMKDLLIPSHLFGKEIALELLSTDGKIIWTKRTIGENRINIRLPDSPQSYILHIHYEENSRIFRILNE